MTLSEELGAMVAKVDERRTEVKVAVDNLEKQEIQLKHYLIQKGLTSSLKVDYKGLYKFLGQSNG